jgi:hypothetical protein
MQNYIEFLGFIFIVFLLGFFLLRYLNGSYTYEDTIYSTNRYQCRAENFMGTNSYYVDRIVIKRKYHSGKIKFIEKEVKI